ncbi:hypothetical protein F5Y14DRAFT_187578 [Nemania sp. NC0429]|nr:hypothetical protein F5Y14DRAFT_187578 [Nemania sp. NC0429]
METQITDMQEKSRARPQGGNKPMDAEAQMGTTEIKPQQNKTAATTQVVAAPKKRLLPFDPAKVRAAAQSKKNAGAKPTGVVAATTTAKPRISKTKTKKPPSGGPPSLDLSKTLAAARRWENKGGSVVSYVIRNPETGCLGRSRRSQEGERAEISVVHAAGCACLDVRLMHICQHVGRVVRAGHLARRWRDAFVIALKIRLELSLPLPLPKEVRFPVVRRQVIHRPAAEVRAETRPLDVVDVYHQQRLVESWVDLEVYRARLIWRDW